MSNGNSACRTVGTGGVGESGASSFIGHTVGDGLQKMIVLRTVGTSLCPNTGACAMLTVNGLPVAGVDMTAVGSSIQTLAMPGARIGAIAHTVPLFNGISCVRLGELQLHLDECDLVTVASRDAHRRSSNWFAWNNRQPPGPPSFHIVGEVEVPNPGVDVCLTPRIPQGINPAIIQLELTFVQRPGFFIQIPQIKPVRYDKYNASYADAEIFSGTQLMDRVHVIDVQ